jgi:hypothetical protein
MECNYYLTVLTTHRQLPCAAYLQEVRMKHTTQLIVTLLLGLTLSTGSSAKETVGWVERVRISPGKLILKAKIDTGAKTSSLNCECKNVIKRDGEDWLRFSVMNDKGKRVWLERKVVRISKVKRHFGDVQERPVIKLGICLGNTFRETEVNVVDRSGLNYQMLIGRAFLAEHFTVDPGETYISKPSCAEGAIEE